MTERPPLTTFGETLARERRSRSLSLRALADDAGMHASEVYRIEQGTREPRLSTILRLAKALGVSSAHLMQGLDEQ